jgi:hypothetical protein
MENRRERRIHLVNDTMPKMLTGMPQKEKWSGYGTRLLPYTVDAPPGKKQLLTFQG